MTRKSIALIVAIVVCLVFTQAVFAEATQYPTEFKQLDYEAESYSLSDAFWFNPTIYAVDMLSFLQAYLKPESPVEYFLAASQYTDEQIEEEFVIFQAFTEPEYVGFVNFVYTCDVESYAQSLGYVFDPELSYSFSNMFEELSDIAAIFPRGIGRTDAYNTFRRTALHLAWYAREYGKTPGFDACSQFIDYIISYYEQQFEEAMAAEAAVMMEMDI
ncbi:MAG: hypothetical protein MJ057_06475 [Sphaerochaetaceae bacterium]|nr:hypothetical protein [Sphaerochaetaceae bacterium]